MAKTSGAGNMEFTILVWKSKNALKSSIFAIIDKVADLETGTGKLGDVRLGQGIWDSYRALREDQLKITAEAKASIAECGYYLIGGDVTEIKNSPPLDDDDAKKWIGSKFDPPSS